MSTNEETDEDLPKDISGSPRGVDPYAPGNTREDGSYRVGKGRPPEHSRFREGDGRKRGRRPKGLRNFDTEFEEEGRRKITFRESGKERRVTKMRGTIIRTYDSALTKGDPRAASLVFSHAARISEKKILNAPRLAPDDDEELNAWLRERLAVIQGSEPEVTEYRGDFPPPSSTPEQAGDDQ